MVKFRTLAIANATYFSGLTKAFAADETGATAIEYGLIAGLISVVVIGAVTNVGTNITNKFTAVASNLT